MSEIPTWLQSFKWESIEQKEAFMSFLYWARSHGLDASVRPVDLFFFQKDHDSNEYWRDTMSTQIGKLFTEIRRLHEIIAELKSGNGQSCQRN